MPYTRVFFTSEIYMFHFHIGEMTRSTSSPCWRFRNL